MLTLVKRKRIDLTLISHSGKWLIESKALAYKSEERASLVLNRKNEKSRWLVLSVGNSDPQQDFPSDGTEYKEINPFTAEEFDVDGIEAVIRYYIFKAMEEKKDRGLLSRIFEILIAPIFVGTFTIEDLPRVPEESRLQLQKQLKHLNFFETVNLLDTPT
jgi:hypothetical protein